MDATDNIRMPSQPADSMESRPTKGKGKKNGKKKGEGNEAQKHGFVWESEISKLHGVTDEDRTQIKYTSKHDIPASLNRVGEYNGSIKTTGNPNMVCMADAKRVYHAVSSGEKYHMIVVYYKQEGGFKTQKSIIEVDLTDSRSLLFGTLTLEQIEKLDALVKSVPQKIEPTKEERQKMYALRDALHMSSGAIQLNIKCNSTQSRLQCSFNKFQKFLDENPTRIVAKSDTNEFRGGFISPQIESSRRVFARKTNAKTPECHDISI
jgi:hypothetical protein